MSAQVLRLAAPADRPPPFMAFAADEATRAVMIAAAELMGFEATAVIAGDPALAAASLREIPTPDVLVVDIDGELAVAEAVERLAEVCDPSAHVVLVGSVNDVGFYRDLKAAGVGDYLVKPLTPAALGQAMQKPPPAAAAVPAMDPAEGIRIGVVGARGGVGATSLATSLAWLLAQERGIHTALVDLDVRFGSVALALDLEPGRGLAEAMENPARVDDLFIERATLSVTETLGVLASEADPATCAPAPDAAPLLTAHLCRSFAAVVLDIPREQAGDAALMTALDHLVVVSEPTLAGLRDAVRLKALVLGMGLSDAALHVIVNRAGLFAKGELDAKTMAAGGHLDISHVLPFDAKSAAAAMTEGRPLVQAAGRAKLGKALRALLCEVAPVEDAPSTSGFARLFRRGP